LSEPEVQQLAAGWQAMLAGIAAHVTRAGAGGHTPSDFQLTELSQDELDELESMAKEIERG
jgi:non-ribosomal peptide synthase protein (TIGR01720 family)